MGDIVHRRHSVWETQCIGDTVVSSFMCWSQDNLCANRKELTHRLLFSTGTKSMCVCYKYEPSAAIWALHSLLPYGHYTASCCCCQSVTCQSVGSPCLSCVASIKKSWKSPYLRGLSSALRHNRTIITPSARHNRTITAPSPHHHHTITTPSAHHHHTITTPRLTGTGPECGGWHEERG